MIANPAATREQVKDEIKAVYHTDSYLPVSYTHLVKVDPLFLCDCNMVFIELLEILLIASASLPCVAEIVVGMKLDCRVRLEILWDQLSMQAVLPPAPAASAPASCSTA